MKSNLLVVLAVSFAVHLLGAQSLYAKESKPLPGYIIAEQEILDADAAKSFSACVGPTLKAFNGKALVRGGKTEVVDGEPPKRIVVLLFESAAVARNWVNSAAHKACQPLQEKAMRERVFIVEGLAQ
jgi:uncharacterized protein (DUF1330 family)